jgi:hypothetical protein
MNLCLKYKTKCKQAGKTPDPLALEVLKETEAQMGQMDKDIAWLLERADKPTMDTYTDRIFQTP